MLVIHHYIRQWMVDDTGGYQMLSTNLQMDGTTL